jgi:hypothetical protein
MLSAYNFYTKIFDSVNLKSAKSQILSFAVFMHIILIFEFGGSMLSISPCLQHMMHNNHPHKYVSNNNLITHSNTKQCECLSIEYHRRGYNH